MKAILTILGVLLVAMPLLLLAAFALGPVALAIAGILLVAGLVLAGLFLVEALTGARFGPFPEPTGSPRPRH